MLVTVAAPPTLSTLSGVILNAGQSGSEPFSDTGTGTLTVTATSSNTTLLPNSGITGESNCTAAGSCMLAIKPASGQSGSATVTVTINDGYGQSAMGTFDVAVKASSTPTTGSGGSGSGGGGSLGPVGLGLLFALAGMAALIRRRGNRQEHLGTKLSKQ